MLNTVENWLMNVALGKLVARIAIIAASYVAGPVIQGFAGKVGIGLSVDPVKLQAELLTLAMAAFEWFKARRAANPASVTVQTDPAKVAPAPATPV